MLVLVVWWERHLIFFVVVLLLSFLLLFFFGVKKVQDVLKKHEAYVWFHGLGVLLSGGPISESPYDGWIRCNVLGEL